jgi:cyanophycinase
LTAFIEALSVPAMQQSDSGDPRVRPRTFLLLGSGEFEPWTADVERRTLETAKGDGSVVVLPTASALEGDKVFDRWGTMGLAHYESVGVRAEVLPLKQRDDAMRDDLASRVEAASMIFFSGGKPKHLADVLDGTPVLAAILRALDRGAVWAGCSAGAMVTSQSRAQRDARDGIGSSWVYGLGLIEHVSFGVHWDKARWIPGMRPFIESRVPPGSWFVGIDERTAILGNGHSWEVAGLKTVTVRHADGTTTHGAGERFATAVMPRPA